MWYQKILISIVALILIIIAIRLFSTQIKFLIRILLNSLIGIVCLIAFNFIGVNIGVVIGVNLFTVLTIGILGIPGFITLLILKLIF